MEIAKLFGYKIFEKTGRRWLNWTVWFAFTWMIVVPFMVSNNTEFYFLRIVFMQGIVVGTFFFLLVSSIVPRSVLVKDSIVKPRGGRVEYYMTETAAVLIVLVCLSCFYFILTNFIPETKFLYNFYQGNVETKVVTSKITKKSVAGYTSMHLVYFHIENYPKELTFYVPVPLRNLRIGQEHKFLIVPEKDMVLAVDEYIPEKYLKQAQ